MIEQLISFETAKLAKEKGFDIKVLYHYWFENNKWILKSNEESVRGVDIFTTGSAIIINVEELLDNYDVIGNPEIFKAAPTQSLLQKWLREIHGIHIILIPTITSSWTYKTITVISKRDNEVILGIKSVSDLPPYKEVCGYDFSTYEKALEKGLVEGLKLIKI